MDSAAGKTSDVLLIEIHRAIYGNGQPGLAQRVAKLEERDSQGLASALKPHIGSILKILLTLAAMGLVGAYGLVWAVAHQWPKLP